MQIGEHFRKRGRLKHGLVLKVFARLCYAMNVLRVLRAVVC